MSIEKSRARLSDADTASVRCYSLYDRVELLISNGGALEMDAINAYVLIYAIGVSAHQ